MTYEAVIATIAVIATLVGLVWWCWLDNHPAPALDPGGPEQSRPPLDATMKLLEMHLPYGWQCRSGGHVDRPDGRSYYLDVITSCRYPVFRIHHGGEWIDSRFVDVDPTSLAQVFVSHYDSTKDQP